MALPIIVAVLQACASGQATAPQAQTQPAATLPPSLPQSAAEFACEKGTPPFEVCQPEGWVAFGSLTPFSTVNLDADPLAQAKKYLLASVEVDGELLRAQGCVAAGNDVSSLANRVSVEETTAKGSFAQLFLSRLVDSTLTGLTEALGDELDEQTARSAQSRIAAELTKQLQASQAISGGDAVYFRLSIPASLSKTNEKTALSELSGCDGKVVVDGVAGVGVKALRVDARRLSSLDPSRIVRTALASMESLTEAQRSTLEARLAEAWNLSKSSAMKLQWTSNFLVPLAYRTQGFGTTPAAQADARRGFDMLRLVTQPEDTNAS